ncbi:MAG: hypothetical protein MZW92_81280 [Comamonadaceae bacterium]|nr:hypothetical protein [Comamonadaceae bacterium]
MTWRALSAVPSTATGQPSRRAICASTAIAGSAKRVRRVARRCRSTPRPRT